MGFLIYILIFLPIIIPSILIISDFIKSIRRLSKVKKKLNDYSEVNFKSFLLNLEQNENELKQTQFEVPKMSEQIEKLKADINIVSPNKIDPLKKIFKDENIRSE